MESRAFVRRVRLRNYKSIAACDVALGPLTFLVGRNGAGKSNFLDSMRLVSDALRSSLDHALRERGGVSEVRRRSGGHPNHFGVRLDFRLPNEDTDSWFAFEVGAKAGGHFFVRREHCSLNGGRASYDVRDGRVHDCSIERPPAALGDRLYLVNLSGLPAFRPAFDALCNMGFYNFNPAVMRFPQKPDAGEALSRDGHNLPSVLARLAEEAPAAKLRIEEYLRAIVPGLAGVSRQSVGPYETTQFRQDVSGAGHPWSFSAVNMSDGTLRVVATLVALFQPSSDRTMPSMRLIGIEEPETALHPAAAGMLIDAFRDAAQSTQIVVTSHSPDLLDSGDLSTDEILAVVSERGESHVGHLSSAALHSLSQHLYTAGELLRMDELEPAEETRPVASGQLHLFREDEA